MSPLTKKGKKVKKVMREQYGNEKGTRIFYASENKKTITGVKKKRKRPLLKSKV